MTSASLAADGVYVYTDRSFDPATGTAKGLRSDFNFGTPAKGYASETDRPGKQRAEYKAFIEKKIYPLLDAASRKGERSRKDVDGDVLGVTFGGAIITEYEIVRALVQDVSLAGFGLTVVALYMWAHMSGSVFLTIAGMFEIAISFPAAYFFYRVVMGLRYVSILQFLSVFVILGIGVDDIFVFYDTYAQATAATGRDTDLVLRLSYAYKHAGRAMLVTSFTSAAAFCSNLASAIPAVQVFGVFIAIMVVLNYVAAVSWFPACIAFWETRLLNRGGGGGKFTPECCRSIPKPLATMNAWFKRKFPRLSQMASFKTYAEWLHRSRYQLLALCFAIIVGSSFFAWRLPPSSEVPKLFPLDHNVQRFIDWTQSRFADESLSCASYTECAEESLEELNDLEKMVPPAGPPSPGDGGSSGPPGSGGGGGGGGGVGGISPPPPPPPRVPPFTDEQLGDLADVLLRIFDADDDGGLNATEAGTAFSAMRFSGEGLVDGVLR